LLGEGMPMKRVAQSSGREEDEITKLKSQLKGFTFTTIEDKSFLKLLFP
jgi:hypothetical protein